MNGRDPAVPGFIEAFLETAISKPDLCALEMLDGAERKQTWSYGELLSLIERYRFIFLSLNVKAGDAVMLHLQSCPEFIASVYALASIGAIFAPVNPQLTHSELNAILEDLRPSGVITSAAHAHLFKGAQLQFVLLIDDTLPDGRSVLTAPVGNPIVSCHYTYKGLGYPLGVSHKYEDYSWCVMGVISVFAARNGDVHLVGLPVHAVYGLIAEVLGPLSTGGCLLITNGIFDIGMVEVLERYQVAFACMVPLLLRSLTSKVIKRSKPFRPNPNLCIVCGGSFLEPGLADEAKSILGVDVYQGYGLTETLPILSTYPGKNKRGSIGVPLLPAFEVRIVDGNGAEVDRNVAGQLAVRGPTLLQDFRKKPAETASFLRDGWFMTGDLGYQDDDGFFYFLGRSYAFTKVASQMVDLTEVESALTAHPAVVKARVTVRKRSHMGESLTASVVLHKDMTATEDELRKSCKQLLSAHKIPRQIIFAREQ